MSQRANELTLRETNANICDVSPKHLLILNSICFPLLPSPSVIICTNKSGALHACNRSPNKEGHLATIHLAMLSHLSGEYIFPDIDSVGLISFALCIMVLLVICKDTKSFS